MMVLEEMRFVPPLLFSSQTMCLRLIPHVEASGDRPGSAAPCLTACFPTGIKLYSLSIPFRLEVSAVFAGSTRDLGVWLLLIMH